ADMAGLWIRTLYRIPLIVTLHSMEPLRPWKADQLGTGYLLSSWIEKTAVEAADRAIAVSRQMREDILAHFSVDPAKVVVIHNGIDPERFGRTERRDALDRFGVRTPYVLFVGRVTDQKGIFHLLEAAKLLPAGVRVVLCASAPDTAEIEERLRRALPAHPNVVWINEMVPHDVVVQLYSHAAVFACASVYEPFGLINLEAMACETPVVASAVGGILEVVVDGETGLLVPPAHPDALAAALTRVLEDTPLGRAMGRAGRQRAEPQGGGGARGAPRGGSRSRVPHRALTRDGGGHSPAAPRARRHVRRAHADAARDHRRGDRRTVRALACSRHRRPRARRGNRARGPRDRRAEGLPARHRRRRRQRLRPHVRAAHRGCARRSGRRTARHAERGPAPAARGR